MRIRDKLQIRRKRENDIYFIIDDVLDFIRFIALIFVIYIERESERDSEEGREIVRER